MTTNPDPTDALVGRKIRAARRAREMSQEVLAEKIGVTYQQLSKYESAENRISAGRLHAIARALGVPISTFFDEVESGARP